MTGQLTLDFAPGPAAQRQWDIAEIHAATGIYTVPPEIEALLDQLGWPSPGSRLLDPGAGNGGFLVGALARLDLPCGDAQEAARRVRGYEFYTGAVADARRAVCDHLLGRGWPGAAAQAAATAVVEERDFLLDPVPAGEFDVFAANPPYWRLANLPAAYRVDYEAAVPDHARADMLYAYLNRSAEVIAAGGRIGLIAADRWLLNSGSAELRRRLGCRFQVTGVRRLDASSVFYRPKLRRQGTPPRVHPVSLVLTPSGKGRALTGDPFRLSSLPAADGIPFRDLAVIRLAPWLGPDGIFLVDDRVRRLLPASHLVAAAEPGDITSSGDLRPTRRWAITTTADKPPPAVLTHLDKNLHRMPPRGRRSIRWLPPETFTGRLPLPYDAVLIPRIATRLRAIRLPAGRLPVNHQLVVASGMTVPAITAMLEHPDVQAQAEVLSRPVDGGYRDYTATLLRHLIIPRHLAGDTALLRVAHSEGGPPDDDRDSEEDSGICP